MTTLFDPAHFGDIATANRIVMAPLTRNRAAAGQVPTPLMATYYLQRASAGLIVSEATQVCRRRARATWPRPASTAPSRSPAGGASPTPCTRRVARS